MKFYLEVIKFVLYDKVVILLFYFVLLSIKYVSLFGEKNDYIC